MFYKWGILNEERRKSLIRFNNSLKSMLVQQQNVFEGMKYPLISVLIDGTRMSNKSGTCLEKK